jgi:hypothetical protein
MQPSVNSILLSIECVLRPDKLNGGSIQLGNNQGFFTNDISTATDMK